MGDDFMIDVRTDYVITDFDTLCWTSVTDSHGKTNVQLGAIKGSTLHRWRITIP
jgi:hypothetical protein